nr:ribonuclease H-like domain-containing protein [Tanacetum cinerariifolium]
MTKKQKREYYMAVIKSNLGWRFKDFKATWVGGSKISKEESERLKRKGLNLEKEKVKKQKSSEEPPEFETITKEFTKEKIKEMMYDRSSEPSTNDLKMCDSSVECSRPNHSNHDSTSSVFAPASESRDTIVIDCDKQEDFRSVCSIETNVKSSKPLFFAGQPNPVSAGQQNTVSVGPPNPVYAGQPNPVYAGDGILVSQICDQAHRVFFTENECLVIFKDFPLPDLCLVILSIPRKHNLYTFSLNELTPKGPLTCLIAKASQNESTLWHRRLGHVNFKNMNKLVKGNKDKLEDFEDFDGGEVIFGGSTRKISGKGTIKTKNLNFENVLYVKELQHFNLISVSQIRDQAHRVLFTENECLVLSKDFPLLDHSMVILSIPRKHNLYTFSLDELAPKGHLTCLIAKALQNESTLWHRRLGHVNFRNMNKLETTSVSAGATIAAGDPIPIVISVLAAFSVPAETPIAAGVSTTAGASGSTSEATVPIIQLLDSPPKDTSIPLDPKTEKHDVPLRKSLRKKSIARRRTLPSPSKSKSAALPFDEDDPEAKFKRYLRQVSNDDEPAEPVSLALVSDIHTTVKRFSTLMELMYWAGRADLMVLYGMVSDKYKIERATGIGLGLWSDLRTLITAREDRDASIIWDDHDQWAIKS